MMTVAAICLSVFGDDLAGNFLKGKESENFHDARGLIEGTGNELP